MDCGDGTAMYVPGNESRLLTRISLLSKTSNYSFILLISLGLYRNDITVRFVDENNKELGRDYFVSPSGQCTVSGYGNIKTITPRGGNNVYLIATCDLCGKMAGGSLSSAQMPISGQVTDCF